LIIPARERGNDLVDIISSKLTLASYKGQSGAATRIAIKFSFGR
jgi:hypothetical protein